LILRRTSSLSSLIGNSAVFLVFAILACAPASWGQGPEFEKAFHQGTDALHSGRWNEAVDAFTKAASLAPTSGPTFLNLGLARLQQGHLDEAVTALSKATALSPRLRGANLFLGIARYRTNDYSSAISALKRETQLDPQNSKALMWLGVAQLGAGDAGSASATLDKAAQLSPSDVDILYHRGRAHMLVSKESYEQMYRAAPESWRVHQVLAQSYVEADRLEDAAKECEIALSQQPKEPGLHEELGDIYQKQNQLEKAESAFQEELQIDPESLTSIYKLAVVSLERSKPQVTVSLLTDLLRRSPKYPDAHYQLGRAQAQVGDVDAAIKTFNAAIADAGQTKSESLRQSYYQLAQLYRRAQKPEESRAALDSFLRLKQQADARQAQKLEDKMKRANDAQNDGQETVR